MVMVKEVIREAAPAAQQAATAVQPNAAQQQARIAYLVKQIAADDAQPKQPTPQEKMAAMDEYKRQKKQAIGAGSDGLSFPVHRFITAGLTEFFEPGIGNAHPIDTKQDANSWRFPGVIHMGKAVHPRLGVVTRLTRHGIHHPGGAARCRDLACAQHIEREGVVGLVARPVRHRDAGF